MQNATSIAPCICPYSRLSTVDAFMKECLSCQWCRFFKACKDQALTAKLLTGATNEGYQDPFGTTKIYQVRQSGPDFCQNCDSETHICNLDSEPGSKPTAICANPYTDFCILRMAEKRHKYHLEVAT